MHEIIGNQIRVHLKGSENSYLSGILVKISDNNLYINRDDEIVFIVPRDNIQYYAANLAILNKRQETIIGEQETIIGEQDDIREKPTSIDVYINKDLIANIPVPPTFDLSQWHDDIYRVIAGNPDVNLALSGRVQKGMQYYPGEVFITIEPEVLKQNSDLNTFVMGAPDITKQIVSPTEMATRLQNVAKGGVKK